MFKSKRQQAADERKTVSDCEATARHFRGQANNTLGCQLSRSFQSSNSKGYSSTDHFLPQLALRTKLE